MSAMKDSGIPWIGMIPEGWGVKKLKNLGYISSGGTPSRNNPDFWNGNINWIKTGELKNNLIYEVEEKITEEGLNNSAAKLFPINTILIAMYGQTRGMTGILKTPSTTNQACVGIIIHEKESSWNYVWMSLISAYDTLLELSKGSAQPNLSSEVIANISVPSPPLETQQRIANYLDEKCAKIEEIVAKEGEVIDKLKAYKLSLITETVTKGLDPNAEMKDSGIEWIGMIPKGWEITKIKYCFKINTGLSITKDNLMDSGTTCINYGEIHSKYGFDLDLARDTLRYVDDSYIKNKPNTLITNGDLVFCDTSEDIEGSGNNVYIKETHGKVLLAGSHTIACRKMGNFNSRYLAYLFNTSSWRAQIQSLVTGTKVYSITQKILKDTKLFLPTLETQNDIVEFLDPKCAKIDETIAKKQAVIEKLGAYKKSLIYEVVTGKKEV